jgi:hemoglobin/transferrin/lactoferrin receptor protein
LIFGVELSYGQVRSMNRTTGEPLSDTLPDQWMGKLEFYPTDQITSGTELRLVEKQNRVPQGTSDTPSYFVEDFFFTYTGRRLEASLRVNNAFDRKYRKHISVIDDPGRDFRIEVSWLF